MLRCSKCVVSKVGVARVSSHTYTLYLFIYIHTCHLFIYIYTYTCHIFTFAYVCLMHDLI